MKRLLVLLLLFTSTGWSQGVFSDGSGFFKTFWRDSAGVIVPVPAGKFVKPTLPSVGSSGYWTRGTAPNSGTVRTSTTTDTVRSGALLVDGGIVANSDADQTFTLGRSRFDSRVTDRAYFSHVDMAGAAQFAVRQLSTGLTDINGVGSMNLMSDGTYRVVVTSQTGRASVTIGTAAGIGEGNFYAGDSLYIGTALFVDANRGVSATSIAAGTALADTSSFDAAAVRKAIYIAGATANDAYVLSTRNTSEVLPVADDQLTPFAKTDSLIVNRTAGTTANLKFSYIRMKH